MVQVIIHEGNVLFEIQGMHKFLAFKDRLIIPLKNIVNVRHDPERAKSAWKGWRAIGTHIPGRLAAGTFRNKGKQMFWDTAVGDNTIVVELANEQYDELVIDVDIPEVVVKRLQNASYEVQA